MSDKPKRGWFQIHLSTAIVLMIVASLILMRNLVTSPKGWPIEFHTTPFKYNPDNELEGVIEQHWSLVLLYRFHVLCGRTLAFSSMF